MAIYTSKNATVRLIDPVDDKTVLMTIPVKNISIKEAPEYAKRGVSRSAATIAHRVRDKASISFDQDVESLALINEMKRWQDGTIWFPLSSDLRGRMFKQPHIELVLTQPDGSLTETMKLYDVAVSDRSMSLSTDAPAAESFSLTSYGGINTPGKEHGLPLRGLDFARTGSTTYLSTAGTLTTAGDGVARIGVPWVARRNLLAWTDLGNAWWTKTNASIIYGAAIAPDGTATAQKFAESTATGAHGVSRLGIALSGSNVWTVYAKAAGRTRIRIDAYDGVDSSVSIFDLSSGTVVSTVTGTATITSFGDGWYRCQVVRSTAIAGSQFVVYLVSSGTTASYAGDGSSGVYLWMPQLEAGTVATPPQPTNATGVDLTHPLNGAGLVLEGSGANLLQSNVATGTDTLANNTGFSAAASFHLAAGATISTTTSQAFQGSRSLSVACSGASQGVETTAISLAANTTYSLSVRAKAGAGSLLQLTGRDYTNGVNAANANITTTGGWDYAYTTITTGASAVADFRLVVKSNQAAAVTFYVDTLQVEASPFPTSWVDGTRQPDLCGIVPPHNELIHSHDLTQSVWGKNATTSVSRPGSNNVVTFGATTDAIWQVVTPPSVTSTPRTAAVKLKLGTLSGSVLFRLLDQSGNHIASKTINTYDLHATDARTFYVTGAAASDDTGLIVHLSGSSGTGTIIVESMRLVRGSHPGVEVQTGDTPIPAPVSPALDPAWQQNGAIEFNAVFLPGGATTGKDVALIGYRDGGGGFATSQFAIWRYGGWDASNNQLYWERQQNGSTNIGGWSGRAMAVSPVKVTDGAAHRFRFEWTNEINETTGVREMWQRLYIDGVLVASQDVAALCGATAWADIDPSRLVSDGNVFSTLGRDSLRIEYPPVRVGYRRAN